MIRLTITSAFSPPGSRRSSFSLPPLAPQLAMPSPPGSTAARSRPTPTVGWVEVGVKSFSGVAFRQARIDRGLSHDALARLIGRSRREIIHWEQGRHPTPALLVALAEALGVDPLELLDVTEDTATLPDLRGRAGLATVEVADHLGVHPTTYRRLERGLAPLAEDTAGTLAALFDTTAVRITEAYARARGDR